MLKEIHRKKYLVVGANSFLAREIIGRIKVDHDVTGVFHSNKDKLFDDLISLHVSEIEQLPDHFDVVIIISAYIPLRGKPVNENLLNEVNAALPEKICSRFKSAKIIYASSVSVYGDGGRLLTESSATLNPSSYGASKKRGEIVVGAGKGNSIVRISSMYGPGMNRSTFIPQIIDMALKDKKIKLFGDGSRRQNYIHVSDVAEFFIRASDSASNGVFLAAGEQSYSNQAVANEVKSILKGTEVVFEGEDQAVSFEYDAQETFRRLGYKPQVNIHDGISGLIQWQQKMF